MLRLRMPPWCAKRSRLLAATRLWCAARRTYGKRSTCSRWRCRRRCCSGPGPPSIRTRSSIPAACIEAGEMQTSFSLAQLANPNIAEADKILRACVHCGFCTATCPTYVLLGDELDSPRGRIYLIKDMLEQDRAASEVEVKHIDRCLSCLSCMTTCPSGVHYMHLVDQARAHIEKTYARPTLDWWLRRALAMILPRPHLFRLALIGGRVARTLGAHRWLPQ